MNKQRSVSPVRSISIRSHPNAHHCLRIQPAQSLELLKDELAALITSRDVCGRSSRARPLLTHMKGQAKELSNVRAQIADLAAMRTSLEAEKNVRRSCLLP